MVKQKNTIGLIGGMGPYASSYFYKLLLDKSRDLYGAVHNDDFPEILINSLPVPDFISDTNKVSEAKNMLISSVRKLNKFGVGSVGMICNTGHILHQDLSKMSKVVFVSMIDVVSKKTFNKDIKRVGVLATTSTIEADLYGKALKKLGIDVFYQDKDIIKIHENIIRNVITGKFNKTDTHLLSKYTKQFVKRNELDGIILGCTELPLVFPANKFINVIDCMDVLADELLVRYYKNI